MLLSIVTVSCAGGGGSGTGGVGGSTLTITTRTNNSSGMVTFTDGFINNEGFYDPSFSGDCDPAAGTLITMCSGVHELGPCDALINIKTSGMTPEDIT